MKSLFRNSLTALFIAWAWVPSFAAAPVVTNERIGAIFYQVLIAELSADRGDLPLAYSLMLDAARKSTSSPLFERAVVFALKANDGNAALEAAKTWQRAEPNNPLADQYLVQILLGLNRLAEVVEPLKRMVNKANLEDKVAIINQLPRYFARISNKKAAAELLKQVLQSELNSTVTGASAWAAIGTQLLISGDRNAALSALEKGIALQKNAPELALLALNGVQAQSSLADTFLLQYIESAPPEISRDMRMTYIRRLVEIARFSEALALAKTATLQINSPGNTNAEAWLLRGSLELQEKQFALAERSLLQYIRLASKPEGTNSSDPANESVPARGIAQAYFFLSQAAEELGRLDDALNYLKLITNPAEPHRVTIRQAQIFSRQGKGAQALALLRALPDSKEEEARIKISAQVDLLRKQKNEPAAYSVLKQALVRFPKDHELTYDLAMSAEKLSKYEEMEILLRAVIASKPDYHGAYNALGYFFADRNIKLGEARELIEKALQFAPRDPYIIDSLGWLEFRSGNTTLALTLLEQAFRDKPDAEIAAHWGEVLWSQGRKEQAQAIWKDGLKLNKENATLLETMRRLNQ